MPDGDLTLAQQFAAHLTDCLDVRRATNVALAKLDTQLDNLNKAAWRMVMTLAGIVLTALATAAVGLFLQASQASAQRQAETHQTQAVILKKLNSLAPVQQ